MAVVVVEAVAAVDWGKIAAATVVVAGMVETGGRGSSSGSDCEFDVGFTVSCF